MSFTSAKVNSTSNTKLIEYTLVISLLVSLGVPLRLFPISEWVRKRESNQSNLVIDLHSSTFVL